MHSNLAASLMLLVMLAGISSAVAAEPAAHDSALTRPIVLAAQDGSCAVSDDDLAIDAEEQAAIDAINRLREAAGVSALAVSTSLTRAAAWKARAMADGAPFEHEDPFRSFGERLSDCGVSTELAVEALAKGVAGGPEVAQFWYDDPTYFHQEVILDPSARWIGIARTVDAEGSVYWCAVLSPQEAALAAGLFLPRHAGET